MALVLHDFRFSVYVRIARIALAEKGMAFCFSRKPSLTTSPTRVNNRCHSPLG
jgi:hypothetical protein